MGMINDALTAFLNGMGGTSRILLRMLLGGMFVLPTIGNPLMYLAAVAVGSAVGCVILGFLKKDAAS